LGITATAARANEEAANAKGVEILVRVGHYSEQTAMIMMGTPLANAARRGITPSVNTGHGSACSELEALARAYPASAASLPYRCPATAPGP
jgi:hypothetical protein